ncbi:alpha/beta hydrolase [Oceaniserpentilla sp. 4NH20-0058]|uniref:alpha/beta fold hydrolase n=1 Tax=Oceaniserpentilla sp. 4NH20-0058 TaxID=3127660 RepID=UPI0031081834
MAYFTKDNAQLHYIDSLSTHPEKPYKETIITTHGMSESHLYWSLSGITESLINAGYRVINTDMRGHGFSEVSGENKGYDINTLVNDIEAMANHLELDKFHLLTHATGGIVGFRYAMEHSDRLLSLLSTNTGSATYPSSEYAELTDPNANIPPLSEIDLKRNSNLARTFKGQRKGDMAEFVRQSAAKNPFLSGMSKLENSETAFALYTACSFVGNPENIADFVDAFYTSYDPCIKGLRQIQCPTLMLVGEYDILFIKPAQLVAREVPNCEHVTMQGIGHMTAFEAPEQLTKILLGFLQKNSATAA